MFFFNRILFNCLFVGDFVLAVLNILLDQFFCFVLEMFVMFMYVCVACSFPGSSFSEVQSIRPPKSDEGEATAE